MTTEAAPAGTPAISIAIRDDFEPTFADMVTLESMGQKGAVKWADICALFNRAVVGGVDALPVNPATLGAIGAALKAHFEARANPNG